MPARRGRADASLSRSERILLGAAAAAALVLRALAFFRYRFDADEQHHAHVAWGWTAGMVPYRDYFDNHAPLFHLLTAPFIAIAGERSDILLWLRAPMLLLFAGSVAATWWAGRHLYGDRVGLWAAVLLALFPPFFLKSLEFRTDTLWTALWMLFVVLLLQRRRPFLLGLVLGCALAVSLKTVLLVLTLLMAWAITRFFVRPATIAISRRDAVAALAGFAVIPAILGTYFVLAGAWDALLYCTITFNGNLAATRTNAWVGRAIFPFTFAAVLGAAWYFRRLADHRWRYFFAVFPGIYSVTLAGFWILISPRDFLPLMPLLAIFAAAAMTRAQRPVLSLAATVVLSTGALWYYADAFEKNTDWHTTMMDQTLRLTRPGETIIDLKGETIYRHRPFYYAFEYITRAQIAHGLIRDTLPEDVVRKRTYVAQADGPMWPPRARRFLNEHFVNVGRLRAAGQWIPEDGAFTIAIPGSYVVVTKRGPARGTLDGTKYEGPRELSPGSHQFLGEKPAVVLWAPAFERGHSPFHLRDTSF
jgi:hypothetical protein